MDERKSLAGKFEEQRPRLRAVAYRMLGSRSDAEDAVQEAWLRLSGTADAEIDDLGAWLTTVVARIALNMLRSRKKRKEFWGPDPIVETALGPSPEHEALLAHSLSLALLVVLETLPPAERVAFVLYDVFGMPFEEIAPVVGRSPDAARQLASRGRRRIQTHHNQPEADVIVQRSVRDAFLVASRDGDLNGLLAVLDPEVILRVNMGASSEQRIEVRGADQVARRSQSFSKTGIIRLPALVNDSAGIVCLREGALFSLMAFAMRDGRIVEIDILSDATRLAQVDLTAFNDGAGA